ncbi:intermembrane space AAA protease IAP-1 [Patellaria atrata CBS 101060]|uniref:Intermembrane space AAA protease IAP-1 n=1 Tax=Patellaria atrata CBS 101060 TaxID=1346257 RepID=A0A9P4VUC3_9PEZI|nr:intermembrane space AAA protease IAP-1 [Patellaria atrata CBS 101060]
MNRLPSSKYYSTMNRLETLGLRPIARPYSPGLIQRRTLFGLSSSSNNQLAYREQAANNNPKSAYSQYAFYSSLLANNLPQIVVQRYQTGQFARNASVDDIYEKALKMMGQSDESGQNIIGQTGNLNAHQLQSVAQAVAARTNGSTGAIAKGGSGDRQSPLYVVVEESTGSTVFRWVKFLAYLAFVGWLSYALLTLLVEAGGMLKKVGGAQATEAKPELQTTRFSDVHGCDEAKEELQELVDFLKAPESFSTLGGKLPKGVLLVGPPGTGKTLLARAVAGEAGVPFFYMSGSEFDEVYVGVGAKRVRELFSAARAKAPSIVFIDELDAIGGKRNERDSAYVKQTLNQLLTDLDGFDQNSGVIFIAATNFPELLDKALTRPGRFDRNVVVGLPDVRGRIAILKHHMRNIQIGTDVDASVIARGTPGFSGAELENICNQAAVYASKSKAAKVHMQHFEWAKDKVLMGAERRSAIIQQKDKVATAYHEGGHALVAMFSKYSDPLYKATIMPRGHALGITFRLPEIDKVSRTYSEYLADIDVCMGGKVAEELVYGPDQVTSGASSDIQSATRIAYTMVTQCGMSELLGNIDLNTNYNKLSSATKERIDSEVRRLVEESRERARGILTKYRKELDLLAEGLVEYETLNKEEMEKVIRGEKLGDKIKAGNSPIKLPEIMLPTAGEIPGAPTPPGGIGEPGPVPGGQPPKPYPVS